MGRHVIGILLQDLLAALDRLSGEIRIVDQVAEPKERLGQGAAME